MSDDERKGLIESVAGKAKEVAGALLHNELLTEQGQAEHEAGEELRGNKPAD